MSAGALTFAGRAAEDDFELAFFVDDVLALDPLLTAVPPVAACIHNGFTPQQTSQSQLTLLAVPRLVLDLVFFSEDVFLPAYVFLGAVSVFFPGGGLTAGFGGLAEAAGFLFALAEDALLGAVFEDAALRAAEDLVAVALLVTVLDLDPDFVTGFGAAFVTGAVLEVLEVGLF
jgi:hypothetical protein